MTTQQVLVTGGGRGIGLGLARRFRARGDRVLVTARSTAGLRNAAAAGMETMVADMARSEDRSMLADHVRKEMPGVDLVVQNAGGQRRVSLAADDAPWSERQAEIDTLLAGPVHLDALLIPTMLAHGRRATMVEVTSGGAVVPQPFAPLYSASKAALHHYTMILRAALDDTAVRVVELMPPAVATGLGGSTGGIELDAFCDTAIAGIDRGDPVVGDGATAAEEVRALVATQQILFDRMRHRIPMAGYATT